MLENHQHMTEHFQRTLESKKAQNKQQQKDHIVLQIKPMALEIKSRPKGPVIIKSWER